MGDESQSGGGDSIDRLEELIGEELDGQTVEELKQEARQKVRHQVEQERRDIEWTESEIELPRLLLQELEDTAAEMGYDNAGQFIVAVLKDAVRYPEFDRQDLRAMLAGEAEIQQDDTSHGDAVKVRHLPPSGRRISPVAIRERVEGDGKAPQHVADEYDLPVAHVYAALAYYHENPEVMAELKTQREEAVEDLREEIEESRPEHVDPQNTDDNESER